MNDFIHLSTDADTVNYAYTQVYADSGGTVIINGTSVTMSPNSKIDIAISTITGANGIYVLGKKKKLNQPTIL